MQELRKTAADQHRSVNAQAVQWFEDEARKQAREADWDELLARIRAAREEMRRKHGPGSDSAAIIRRMRQQRTAQILRAAEGNCGQAGRRNRR